MVFAIIYSSPEEQIDTVGGICAVVLAVMVLVESAAMIFLVQPLLKRKQAKMDFDRYDFNPYTPTENEEFKCEYLLIRYTIAASPFDENTVKECKNDEEAREYIAQHFAQELLRVDEFYCGTEKSPFFISDSSQNRAGVTVRIDKNTDGNTTTLDLTERHTATFTEDGLIVGDRLYPYSAIEGEVAAAFNKETDFHVMVRVLLYFKDGDESGGYLSIELSTRIAEIIKRYNINILNTDMLNYILADPRHAFEQTAYQLILRKLK